MPNNLAMRRCLPQMVQGRAIIGMVALYALLLQAFLGFATPAHAFGTSGAVLCAEHDSGTPDNGAAPLHAHPCCTLVQAVGVALPPSEPVAVAWPFAPALRLAWRPEAERPKTGPPPSATSARGPPAA
ncbi:hypothetical protein MKK67_12370 [Methylobacterium sp. J-072]|uniref:hypothetical protein n=1 Tax=Methylobacterium sp. J-072 TaxID=2836651 RepID=UPI001FB8FDD0|nr:hypothetical protein [Methylobacterium sp. J-072]MCJ2093277.1 hypothetical protein [Methylobacterium sp. J-072]